ncbi:hypothetical protein ANCCAN_06689 [Ancylostoma caninum]|uniref:Uncharacterized protein n=1 Tax=Ancylostoma caninum TaxID=29170 RepID=A0A368GW92_ANCCA|nr:hypothetical protein ANCCAN_06689 [Ancylostoma caninum]
MSDVGDSKMCTFIYSVSCSIIAEILMIFGYSNNAWLVVHNPDSSEQFQRGLNDDCFKSDTIRCSPWCSYSNSTNGFPVPFHLVLPPSAAMYAALHIARILLVLQFMWFSFCILCCCNVKAELFANQYKNLVMYFSGSTGFFRFFFHFFSLCVSLLRMVFFTP